MKIILILMAAILFSPANASTTTSDPSTVIVVAEGVAAIQGDNITHARHAAIQDALKQAVAQGVGIMMDSTTQVENVDLLEKIHSHSQGHVIQYDVIQEKRWYDNVYRAKIEAQVSKADIRASLIDLGIIEPLSDYPRVVVVPDPADPSELAPLVGTILQHQLAAKQFQIVDVDSSQLLHANVQNLLENNTANNIAVKMALAHQAEIALIYRIGVNQAEFDGIMDSCPVRVQARAVSTSTGQILAAENQLRIGLGNTRKTAAENGAALVAEAAIPPIAAAMVEWWWHYALNGYPYVVTLYSKQADDKRITAFQKAVESISGVVSLSERSTGGGMTEMMIKYKGSALDFKRRVLTKLDTVNGFRNLHTALFKGRFWVLTMH